MHSGFVYLLVHELYFIYINKLYHPKNKIRIVNSGTKLPVFEDGSGHLGVFYEQSVNTTGHNEN